MFSNKAIKMYVVAAAIALSAVAQPTFAAPSAMGEAQSSANRAWVVYWLGFLDTLDRVAWAHGD